MQSCLLVVLVGVLIGQAYCQLPSCTCSVMDDCVKKQNDKLTTCGKTCSTTTLTTGGDKALQCGLDMVAAHTKAASAVNDCIEKAAGRPCTTIPSRVLRSASNAAHHQGGFPGGMGAKPFAHITVTGTAKSELASFTKCVFECITKDEPKPAGRPQGRRGFDEWITTTKSGQNGGDQGEQKPWPTTESGQNGQGQGGQEHYEWTTTVGPMKHDMGRGAAHGGPHGKPNIFYGVCPRLNKCSLAQTKNSTEVQTCIKSAIATPSTIEKMFCTCLQGAYSSETVACNF